MLCSPELMRVCQLERPRWQMRKLGRMHRDDSCPVNGGSFSSPWLQSWERLESQTPATPSMVEFIWRADAKLAHFWSLRSPHFSHQAGPSSETVLLVQFTKLTGGGYVVTGPSTGPSVWSCQEDGHSGFIHCSSLCLIHLKWISLGRAPSYPQGQPVMLFKPVLNTMETG